MLSRFKSQFCACSTQPGKKCELVFLFKPKMPVALRVRDYILVRGTYTIF